MERFQLSHPGGRVKCEVEQTQASSDLKFPALWIGSLDHELCFPHTTNILCCVRSRIFVLAGLLGGGLQGVGREPLPPPFQGWIRLWRATRCSKDSLPAAPSWHSSCTFGTDNCATCGTACDTSSVKSSCGSCSACAWAASVTSCCPPLPWPMWW